MKYPIDEKTESLICAFGFYNKDDIKKLSDKISIVVAAHKSAGIEGSNHMCRLNRLLNEIINIIDIVKDTKTNT